MSARARVLTAVAFGAIVLAVGAAPFALMLLPNPTPVAVTDIAGQLPGNYIETGAKVYHVFPRAEEVEVFPADSLIAGPDAVFVVKYRQLASLSAYRMTTADGSREVPTRKDTRERKLLRMRPRRPLAVGRYRVQVARESIYGGDDFVYFSVSAGRSTLDSSRGR